MSDWWRKKWLGKGSGDDFEGDDNFEIDESPRVRRGFTPREPRKISYRNIYETEDQFDDDYDAEVRTQKEDEWEDKAEKIKKGTYKPRRNDSWTLHVLYQNVQENNKKR